MKVLSCIAVVLSLMQFAKTAENSETSTNLCAKYLAGEIPEYGSGNFGLCLEDYKVKDTFWCREWGCPVVNCASPITDGADSCPRCPGTCVSGGKIYNVGENFVDIDGANGCFCSNGGVAGCTMMGTDLKLLCNMDHPDAL